MKANWEIIEKNTGTLTVEVDADQVAKALDKAFKQVAAKVNVPGFRKGKVPRAIFEARFGVESLYADAIDILLPDAYMEAVKATGIDPIDRPEIEIQEFAKGKPFRFSAKVQVKPEVELGQYKGIEVPVKDFSVKPEEVEEELKRMQERHAELIVVEDGTVENGDRAVIDYEGFINGEPFEGGKAEKYSLDIGSNTFIPGFEEQIVGMARGEEKEIQVTFPEDYHRDNLKGQTAVFKVKLHEIKRKQLPALDDEFAKDVSEFDTLDEYKQDIEAKLKVRKEKEREQYVESTVVEKASESATVDIPEVMVDNEVDQMIREFSSRLRLQGMSLELYLQFTGQDEAKLREQLRGDARKRVLQSLVLEAIARAENITVDEQDVQEELEKLSEQFKRPADELKQLYEANGMLDSLKKDLEIRKAVKLLVEHSVPVEAA